jgi:hypothetical protein
MVTEQHISKNNHNMASDWLTVPQAGKWRSKVRTSYTNVSTYKPGTLQMDTPSTRSICLIDGMLWRGGGANIDSDHMLVVIKLIPCQQHKAATTETFCSRQTEE